MSRMHPVTILMAAAALSACSTVAKVGNMFSGNGEHHSANDEPQEGRISILATDQALTPDPSLSSRAITPPSPVELTDWSQPGGNVANAPPNAGGEASLRDAWRANLGQGSNKRVAIAAPPVVADGVLYFIDANQRVIAINSGNGHVLWTQTMRPRHAGRDHFARGGGIAVSGGKVFVTTGYGFIVSLDASNGHEVWRQDGGAPFQSSPTISNGHVFAINNDSELIGMNAETGEVQWNYQAIAEPARILAAPSVAVDGETVVAPFASGELVALLSANGSRLWEDSLSRTGRLTSLSAINDIAGRPVVSNGIVYAVSHSGVLVAIDIRTGSRKWAKPFASTQTPCVIGGVLYAVSVDGELAAFDTATGNIYWVAQLRRYQHEDTHKGRVAWTGPIMVNSKLILANSMGEVVAISPANGETLTRVDVHQPIFIPPITANDQIYLVSDSAHLIVLH
ncbi:MAG: PQQ-binding-like beta-propeller repeat protein [Terricaulis sp.]